LLPTDLIHVNDFGCTIITTFTSKFMNIKSTFVAAVVAEPYGLILSPP
jgi:hypothetical protein